MKRLFKIAGAIIALGLGGAVVAQTIGAVSNGYIEEGNLLRSGNVIQTITMSNRGQDASTCRKACDGDKDCNAYSYVQQTSNRKPICYLRMIALPGGAKRNHGYTQVTSGTKVSYLTDIHKITPYAGRTLKNATQISRFSTASDDPIACSDACYRDGNCKSFTYAPKGTADPKVSICVLNSDVGQLAPASEFLSGVKGGGAKTIRDPRVNPVLKPRLKPNVRPRTDLTPRGNTAGTLPDRTPSGQLSDDDTPEEFPGEMLAPEANGEGDTQNDQQFPGEMLQPESA